MTEATNLTVILLDRTRPGLIPAAEILDRPQTPIHNAKEAIKI